MSIIPDEDNLPLPIELQNDSLPLSSLQSGSAVGDVLAWNGFSWVSATPGVPINGVSGPLTGSSINALSRWTNTDGNMLSNSVITLSDTGVFSSLKSASDVNSSSDFKINDLTVFSIENTNTFAGLTSGYNITTGVNNASLGFESLKSLLGGSRNVSLGSTNLTNLTTGNNNISLGSGTATDLTTGSNNIILGTGVSAGGSNAQSRIVIGNGSGIYDNGFHIPASSKFYFPLLESTVPLSNVLYYDSINGTIAQGTLVAQTSEFLDSVFRINHFNNPSAQLAFDCSSIASSTTRTIKIPNANTLLPIYTSTNISTGNLTAVSGNQNTYYGMDVSVSAGNQNTAIGYQSAKSNLTGSSNLSVGYQSAYLTTGSNVLSIGNQAGYSNTTGQYNTVVGHQANYTNSTGNYSSIYGYQAAYTNQISNVSAFGYQSLYSLTTGSENSAFGYQTLLNTTNGSYNTVFGYNTGKTNISGAGLTAFGSRALEASTGNDNSAFGRNSLLLLSTGTNNSTFGSHAGITLTTGSNNTLLGYNADTPTASTTGSIVVGASAIGKTNFTSTNGNNILTIKTPVANQGAYTNTFRNLPGSYVLNYNSITEEITYVEGGGGGSTFLDDVFRVLNVEDLTKKFAVDCQYVSTATTRTFIIPDIDGILPGLDTQNNLTLGSIVSNITDGTNNTILGKNAGASITSGINNILIGYAVNTTYSNSILVGSSGTANNQIRIGFSGVSSLQTNTYIDGIYNQSITGYIVLADSNGRLGSSDSFSLNTAITANLVFEATAGAQIGYTAGTLPPTNGLLVSGNSYFGSSTSVGNSDKVQIVSGLTLGATASSTTGILRLISASSTNYIQSGLATAGGSAAPLCFTDYGANNIWLSLSATGKLGVGTSSALSWLQVSGDITTTGSAYAMQRITGSGVLSAGVFYSDLLITSSYTQAPSTGLYSVFINPTYTIPAGNSATSYHGIQLTPVLSGSGSGTSTINVMTGIYNRLTMNPPAGNTLTLTTYRGLWIEDVNANGSGTENVNNKYGMHIGAIAATGTATGNNYGIYVDTVSGANTGNYGIISMSRIGIGTAVPTAMLQTVGTIASSSNTLGQQSGAYFNTAVNPTGAVSNAAEVYILPSFSVAGGTIANSYGLRIDSYSVAATANYGLYVSAPTGGTSNNVAAYFGGRVGISDTVPTSMLRVAGILAQSTNSIDSQSCIYVSGAVNPTGAVTEAASLAIQPGFSVASGTIATTHGLLVRTYSVAASNNYGLYVNVPTSGVNRNVAAYFGGQVGIANSTPTGMLNIAGTVAVATDAIAWQSALVVQTAVNPTAAATNVSSLYIVPSFSESGGQITNTHGLRIATYSVAADNNYGLYVEAPTSGTLNFGAVIGGMTSIGSSVSSSAWLNITGDITIPGNDNMVRVSGSGTFPSSSFPVDIKIASSFIGAAGSNYYPIDITPTMTLTNAVTQTGIRSINVDPMVQITASSASATVTLMRGLVVRGVTNIAATSTLTIATHVAMDVTDLSLIGAGATTATTKYGVFVRSMSAAAGTDQYGIYVDAVSGATNNYGIISMSRVGIGTATPGAQLHVAGAITTAQSMFIGTSFTQSSSSIAWGIRLNPTFTTAATSSIYAIEAAPTITVPASTAGDLVSSLYAYTTYSLTATSSTASLTTFSSIISGGALNAGTSSTLTVSVYRGLHVLDVSVSGAGTKVATNKYGIHVAALSNAAGTNQYGVYVDAVTGATNNYGIISMSRVGIGTATPTSSWLQVGGTITANSGIYMLRIAGGGTFTSTSTYNDIYVDSSYTMIASGNATAATLTPLITIPGSTTVASVRGLLSNPRIYMPSGVSGVINSYTSITAGSLIVPLAGTSLTIGEYIGVSVGDSNLNDAGTFAVTTKYGIKIAALTEGAGTNAYGLYVDTVSSATNNYGIISMSKVGIGTAAPTAWLNVAGAITSAGTSYSMQYIGGSGTFNVNTAYSDIWIWSSYTHGGTGSLESVSVAPTVTIPAGNTMNRVRAVRVVPAISGSGAGTSTLTELTSFYTAYDIAPASGNTLNITTYRGLWVADISGTGAGTENINNKYGIHVATIGATGTATGNHYGMYIDTVSGAATGNYGIISMSRVGIGTATPVAWLNVAGDITSSGSSNAMIRIAGSGTAASSTFYFGIQDASSFTMATSTTYHSTRIIPAITIPAGTTASTVRGVHTQPTILVSGSGTATLGDLSGLVSTYDLAPGSGNTVTVTTYRGVWIADISGTGAGTENVNNKYGVHVQALGATGTATGNHYGMYVDTISGAATGNYGIISMSNAGIGTATPSAWLSIAGNISTYTGRNMMLISGSGTFNSASSYYDIQATTSYTMINNSSHTSIFANPTLTITGTTTPSNSYGVYVQSLLQLTTTSATASLNTYASFVAQNTVSAGSASTLTISQWKGLDVLDTSVSSGTVVATNKYGIHVRALNQAPGTNQYGVYVDAVTGATNNYGIISMSRVGIGTATPTSSWLEVAGSITTNSGLRMVRISGSGVLASSTTYRDIFIDSAYTMSGTSFHDTVSASPVLTTNGNALTIASMRASPTIQLTATSTLNTVDNYLAYSVAPTASANTGSTLTIANSFGLHVSDFTITSGSVVLQNRKGIYIAPMSAGTTTSQTRYGMHIDTITTSVGSTNYGIYVNGFSGGLGNSYAGIFMGTVGINTATPSASYLLDVNGGFRASGASDFSSTLTIAGTTRVNAQLGINTAPTSWLHVTGAITTPSGKRMCEITGSGTFDTGTQFNDIKISSQYTSGSTAFLYSLSVTSRVNVPAASSMSTFIAGHFEPIVGGTNSGTSTLGEFTGVYIRGAFVPAAGNTLNVTTYRGLWLADSDAYGSGTENINNKYGIHIENIGATGTASGNHYGIYVGTVSGAATGNYGIISMSRVGVGTATPTAWMHVSGDITTTTNRAILITGSGTMVSSTAYYELFAGSTLTAATNAGLYSLFIDSTLTVPAGASAIVRHYIRAMGTTQGSGTGTSTVSEVTGVYVASAITTAAADNTMTVTTYRGLHINDIGNGGAGTENVNNKYGVHIGVIGATGTATGNHYGMYIDTVSGAATGNYGIISMSRVGVGTATPQRTLDVLDATNPQARLTHTNNSVYTDMQTNSSGHLLLQPTGGSIVPGTAALATNATQGFVYEETCAGQPTGVPTTYTGRAAKVYDTTNNIPWVYNGSWVSGNGQVLISKQVLGVITTSVVFSSIPQVFNHLKCVAICKTTSGSFSALAVQINGSSAANYTSILIGGNGAAFSSGGTTSTSWNVCSIPDTSSTTPAIATFEIPAYTLTTFHKSIISQGGYWNGGGSTQLFTGSFTLNTNAVTSITLTTGPSFPVGCAFYLYGVY